MSTLSTVSHALPVGYFLRDKYTIGNVIDQGGSHITYQATEAGSGRELTISEYSSFYYGERDKDDLVTVLVPPAYRLMHQELMNLSIQTAQLHAKLPCHPNLVRIESIFRDNNTAYKVMDEVKGIALADYFSADTLTEQELKPILLRILSAVDHLHCNGLIHRNIKPHKIIIRPDGDPVLLSSIAMYSLDSTEPAIIIATPGYAPAEQMTDVTPSPLFDIYALGATCYRIITGDEPWREESKPLAECTELHERFSPELLSTIDKAFAMAPEERWQSAQDWMNALR